MTNTELIAEARRHDANAMPGPWAYLFDGLEPGSKPPHVTSRNGLICVTQYAGDGPAIAWLRNNIAALADALEASERDRDNWRHYAESLQRLHDNGGAIMEPALGREVEELREKCLLVTEPGTGRKDAQ